ncbi:Swr1 complex subunit Swc3 [Schizosaccharomyces cryophilus OY26]|uniref:Swr1 complex subunit Swc3 n=1 Tax=Schizosaccharomyces cryophilus (strain OY26 / ATCC MYA-4695 / CBS 11777 / NBRC 106824 / NRRL Y48691) TaxID=653667 RepID=S9VUT2_SCHCR|nr:Swr1 complex subunit Swc3 [Schizosaccharomyces cryophilus OY26]EPY51553.1 Swr1 complex subunit Swc3 [Schizosaccharomyces cryophilus OY26]
MSMDESIYSANDELVKEREESESLKLEAIVSSNFLLLPRASDAFHSSLEKGYHPRVIFSALKKSRESIINGSLFEKYSAKENHYLSGGILHPHYRSLGTATLCVGPLRFENTSFTFVHYSNSVKEPFNAPNISYVNPQYNGLDYRPNLKRPAPMMSAGGETIDDKEKDYEKDLLPPPQYRPPSPKKPEDYESTPGEPVEPLITDESIQHLRIRAQQDPTIMNILKKIAKGLGTPEQCILLHNELIGPSTFPSPRRAKKPPRKRITLTLNQHDKDEFVNSLLSDRKTVRQHFDIIFQFNEAPEQQWILPRGSVLSHVFNTSTKSLNALKLLFHVYQATQERSVTDIKTEIQIKDFNPILRAAIESLVSGSHSERLLMEKHRRLSTPEARYYVQYSERN